jgi:hypothetical protein
VYDATTPAEAAALGLVPVKADAAAAEGGAGDDDDDEGDEGDDACFDVEEIADVEAEMASDPALAEAVATEEARGLTSAQAAALVAVHEVTPPPLLNLRLAFSLPPLPE